MRHFHGVWLLLAISFFHLFAYASDADVTRFRSLYKLSSAGGWGNEIHWVFEKKGAGEMVVHTEEKSESDYILTFSKDNRLERVVQVMNHPGEPDEKVLGVSSPDAPFFLSDGFPLPYDDLNIEDNSITEAVYKKQAGGVSFAFKLNRKMITVSASDAAKANMIDPGFQGIYEGAPLTFVTVTENTRLKVKQLWRPGERWWIYEETPFRKSWRLP
jgi:hypothetical protein